MRPSRHQLLNDALTMSQRMTELGDAGDWDGVVALESQRRQLLEQAFATHAPADEFVTERVRAILDLDKHLMARSVEARDLVAEEIGRTGRGRRAAGAYNAARG